MLLSDTIINYGFFKIEDQNGQDKLMHQYNMGLEDAEYMHSTLIQEEKDIDIAYFADIVTLTEDICDSREVEFIRAEYQETEGNRCIQMTLRNTMAYPVDVDMQHTDSYKHFDLRK